MGGNGATFPPARVCRMRNNQRHMVLVPVGHRTFGMQQVGTIHIAMIRGQDDDGAVGEAGRYTGLRRRASLLALVLVNLLPLLGVLFFHWDVAALVVLYWSENLVLGFYTLVKMLVKSPVGGLGSGIFFLIHYGGFCAVHGLFIIALLVDGNVDPMPGDR